MQNKRKPQNSSQVQNFGAPKTNKFSRKEKSLKPSFRENKRYLLVSAGKEDVEKAILDYIGILGYSKAAPVYVQSGILAVNRQELDKVKAGLLLAGILVKRVSGTLKGLKK